MRKLNALLPFLLLICTYSSKAQIFWVENFESGSSSGLGVASYTTGPNGAWTQTNLSSTGGSFANAWYVSCAEQGHIAGACGDDCSASTALGATLHVGSSILGDNGASYYAGAGAVTNKRAESPTINCMGHTGITLSFYYIENGEAADDDGSVYYSSDGGSSWTLLTNTAKTTTCGSGQGQWAHVSIALPSSANNNPNVKIGFLWVNDNDVNGTDPSFAIDSVSLSTASTTSGVTASFTSSTTTVCEDSCITFTSTSSGGTIDSIRWSIPGVTLATPTTSPMTACFPNSGTYTVHLYVHSGTATDSTTTTVTINPAPHPVITSTGTTLTVSGVGSGTYQWYKNDTAIAGATNSTYSYTGYGSFYVIADSGGCKGESNTIVHNVGVANVSANGVSYTISQTASDRFTLYASQVLTEDMNVQVFDATGRVLIVDKWPAGVSYRQFAAGSLVPGIYIVRISNADNSAVLKWLKQ